LSLKKRKLCAADIEIAVARHFGWRRNIIVPNVSWGLDIHEVDLLIISKAGYATEVEIKVTQSDINADLKKGHGHRSNKIRRLYFAVPDYLNEALGIPDRCGLISVNNDLYCRILRQPKINTKARALRADEINKVLHLGCMRIWRLKDIIRYSSRQGSLF